MSEKLPPRVKQTAVDHRLAVESGSAGWDQPGGKPYKQSPTPKTRKPKLPAGDGMDPMFLPAPQYKKPARVRPEKAKKKQKAKLPKQPPATGPALQADVVAVQQVLEGGAGFRCGRTRQRRQLRGRTGRPGGLSRLMAARIVWWGDVYVGRRRDSQRTRCV